MEKASKTPEIQVPAQVGEYVIDLKIGSGSYGTVYRGYKLSGNRNIFYALKFVNKEYTMEDEDRIRRFQHEIRCMSMVSHQNVVQKHDFFETKDDFVIVMQYCAKGNLCDFIKKEAGFISESKAAMIFEQIASGMMALNKKNICHRDLKPQNIFIQSGGLMVIGDFGFAKILSVKNTLMESELGTPMTKAPEVWDNEDNLTGIQYTNKVDIWSLGCIFYFVLFKKFPFGGETKEELFKNMMKHSGMDLNFESKRTSPISKEAKNLLISMLEKDENKRISWEEFERHPFFSKFSNRSLGQSGIETFKTGNVLIEMSFQTPTSFLSIKEASKTTYALNQAKMNETEQQFLGFDPRQFAIYQKEPIVFSIKNIVKVQTLDNEKAALEECARYLEHIDALCDFLEELIIKSNGLGSRKEFTEEKGLLRTIIVVLHQKLIDLLEETLKNLEYTEEDTFLTSEEKCWSCIEMKEKPTLLLKGCRLHMQKKEGAKDFEKYQEKLNMHRKNQKEIVPAILKSAEEKRTKLEKSHADLIVRLSNAEINQEKYSQEFRLIGKHLAKIFRKKRFSTEDLEIESVYLVYRIALVASAPTKEIFPLKSSQWNAASESYFDWFGFYQEIYLSTCEELLEKTAEILNIS